MFLLCNLWYKLNLLLYFNHDSSCDDTLSTVQKDVIQWMMYRMLFLMFIYVSRIFCTQKKIKNPKQKNIKPRNQQTLKKQFRLFPALLYAHCGNRQSRITLCVAINICLLFTADTTRGADRRKVPIAQWPWGAHTATSFSRRRPASTTASLLVPLNTRPPPTTTTTLDDDTGTVTSCLEIVVACSTVTTAQSTGTDTCTFGNDPSPALHPRYPAITWPRPPPCWFRLASRVAAAARGARTRWWCTSAGMHGAPSNDHPWYRRCLCRCQRWMSPRSRRHVRTPSSRQSPISHTIINSMLRMTTNRRH